MLTDIQNRNDIETLVSTFYQKAIPDALIGHFFTTVKPLNMAVHLPKISDFWESMLLGSPVYSGSPMQVHLMLNQLSPMKPEHFKQWLRLWSETVDELFSGEIARLAKERGHMVARSIGMRLEDLAR